MKHYKYSEVLALKHYKHYKYILYLEVFCNHVLTGSTQTVGTYQFIMYSCQFLLWVEIVGFWSLFVGHASHSQQHKKENKQLIQIAFRDFSRILDLGNHSSATFESSCLYTFCTWMEPARIKINTQLIFFFDSCEYCSKYSLN